MEEIPSDFNSLLSIDHINIKRFAILMANEKKQKTINFIC